MVNEIIKAMRLKRELSQLQLCKRLGMAQQNYSRLENKEAALKKAKEIAEELDFELVLSFRDKDFLEKLRTGVKPSLLRNLISIGYDHQTSEKLFNQINSHEEIEPIVHDILKYALRTGKSKEWFEEDVAKECPAFEFN